MSTWSATIEDKDVNILSFCDSLAGGTLTLPLNAPGEFEGTFDLGGNDTAALLSQLGTGGVFIRVFEDGTTRFWGQLSDLQADIGEDGTLTARFTDLAGVYANVVTYQTGRTTGGNTFYKPYETQGAKSHNTIIDAVLNLGNPLVRLTRSGSVTATRTITFDQITALEALTQLSDFANGIDWYVTPDSTLTIATTLGTDKTDSVIFQYGSVGLSNVNAATVQYQPPRNRIYTVNDKGLINKRPDATGVSSYGSYASIIANAPKGAQQTVEDQADQRLRSAWRQVLELDVALTVAPRPWTNFYLGDTVTIDVAKGAYVCSTPERVNQIQFTFDDNMIETAQQLSFEVV
jgi:hypothetical protein